MPSTCCNQWQLCIHCAAPIPHFVTFKESGQFVWSSCTQWENLKICSYTVALAEKVEKFAFYTGTMQQLSSQMSPLGMLNITKGRGQKGGVPKWKRVRKPAPEPKQITSRPSLTTSLSSISPSTSPSHMESNTGPFSDILNYYSPTYNYSGYPPAGSSVHPWFYPHMAWHL